ncbi:hypothetical protein G4B88_023660 [Cannabis sativa]|uniref:Uncharacterized protein n=1 Tax=Cannabis sativa TaxID=3483 RepID=A0A7J6HV31_CANSA|nr:hypothetical protein G4B88_023660 [Cannabis sativa]
MACLFPRPAESEYVQGLTVGDAPLYVDMGVDETQGDDSTTHQSEFQRQAAKVAEFAQSTNIFPVDPPPPPPPAPATTASSSTSALMEIVSLGDTQTPVGGQDCDVEEAEPFANRKRPIYLDDYTSMRKKACAARTVVNMDPLQVHMIKPAILTPKLEHNTISSTLTLLLQDQSSMNRFGVNYFMSMEKKKKVLEEKICKIGLTIQAVEEKYAKLNKKREEIEQTIKELQDSTETHQLGFLNHLSTKEEVIEQIEKISNSSTAVLVNISRGVPFREPENHIMKDIIGVVALLGRVQCGQLSRILSEYLGADQMLAVVARSFEAAAQFETYTQTGEVDRSYALHAEAAVLGKSINCRFTVICFDKICLYKGGFNNHPQRRLALPVPWFIDGTIPKGFLGFAVNMIDLDEDHLSIKNNSGYGLRETVFYRLFGQLQVYQTREDMLAACACIKHGAVSLDGGILKENGVLSFGFRYMLLYSFFSISTHFSYDFSVKMVCFMIVLSDPQVCFQVVTTNDEMPLSQENLKLLQDQKSELKIINDKIEQNIKHHGLALNSFKKTKKELKKMMDELETCIGSNTQ